MRWDRIADACEGLVIKLSLVVWLAFLVVTSLGDYFHWPWGVVVSLATAVVLCPAVFAVASGLADAWGTWRLRRDR